MRNTLTDFQNFIFVSSKVMLFGYPSFAMEEKPLNFQARWACFSPSFEVLCVGNNGSACIINEQVRMLNTGVKQNIRCAAYFNEKLLLVGNGGLVLYGQSFERLDSHTTENLRRVVWSPDGKSALILGNNGSALLFDSQNKELLNLEGAINNLRGAVWVEGKEPIIVGNAYASAFVPTPNVYKFTQKKLEPLVQEPKVDLISVDWCFKKFYMMVGYDVVLHEARVYKMDGDFQSVEWKEQGVYLSAVAFHPTEEMALIATSHPSLQSDRIGFVYLYERGEVKPLFKLQGYGFVCASWRKDGKKALLLASKSVRTFDV
ncbi:hypothetical protein B9Q01_03250 [Candidatus Marsarchaeota G1 archaeon OSP_D]|uniref:Anaphase-promoting complex subunit 4 WD40 domain-containing protein n=3 Tax=Candidatus Marsarchaeota group 1 TaxID=2203770 RepID=A0A2R6AF17_9ARCH|nr:MAG: hypothetical protein B9Q01_03250 [Candidatus Marsarchaeota G1 archaeon OSP_D]PSN84949.1 MAG: hypothetical protein B9Q02_08155 [Candidatus Marsarchaeota G1 archaeon BE_D]PSN89234.1 MAG: hypothetical protein B9Q00_02475 [Candidatus Marsarchaeota G1 archaeon OSP_C]